MMSLLAEYDRAGAALAGAMQASQVGAVLASRAELEQVKLFAKQVNDRALVADANELQMRCERRLGVLLRNRRSLRGTCRQGATAGGGCTGDAERDRSRSKAVGEGEAGRRGRRR
jgi:hypothetical protein